MRAITTGGLAAAALLLGATAAGAQESAATDGRWMALVGCWAPAEQAGGPAAVCVLPAGGSAVELLTVAGGQVRERERIDATGAALPTAREGCAGTDEARWSADGRRLFLRSAHACDGVKLGATGIVAMVSADEWLDVRGASMAGGPPDVRVRRYRTLVDRAVLPAELQARLDAVARPTVQAAARAAAAADVTTREVTEAARAVDAPVVEAWVLARGEALAVDARRLEAMADAQVPDQVIDAVVAVSFPRHFVIDASREVAPREPAADSTRPVTAPIYGTGALDRPLYCQSLMYSARRECWGYSQFGWAQQQFAGAGFLPGPWYGYGFGYDPYGPPVIVPRGREGPRGRAVKGRGYTRTDDGGEPSTGSARPRTERTTSGTSASSGSSGGSRSSSGGSTTRASGGESKSSSGSSTGRTARPKNP